MSIFAVEIINEPTWFFKSKNKMKYNEIGKTGMKVSELSFGASSLGGVFHDIDEKRAIEAVYAAVEGGMNFIDVSPYYGYYKAETVLGKALRGIDRKKYYLSTKVGRYGKDGVNTWDYSAKRAKESVYESMERMGVDHIDLINVHDIEFSDLNQVVNETLPALVELREEGVVSHVGITDLQLENLKWVIDRVPRGTVESVLNFCHYTLSDDRLADFLDYFESKGVGVINASPLSMGLLTQRGVPAWHPAPKALVEACAKAAEYCGKVGYPIEKLAMQFSVSNPRIATTLFSSSNPDNVRKNIAYVEEPIDWDLVKAVKDIIGDQQRVTWKNT
jgi:aryl-alcohol dehydrogenase-like predicted oxidoreductase